jgi:FkbM family methyltransferase
MTAADLGRGWQLSDRYARALGFARSLATYHGLPWRARALRRHYAAFLGPGDLAFDVGAHVGNHARCFAGLGAQVIAIEPQPAFAAWLRRLFHASPQVTVLEYALAATPGVVELYVSPRTPTVATVAPGWMDAVRRSSAFEQVHWTETVEVPATTLDALIGGHGVPRFCKIDAAGLLAELGRYRFNLTIGERRRFMWPEWRPIAVLDAWLAARRVDDRSGDVYARLEH